MTGKVVGLAAVPPLAFALSAVAARALLAHPMGTVASGLAQPLGVVTNWHATGVELLALLAAAIGISAVAYVRALVIAEPGDVAAIAIGTCATLAAAWLWPAIFSSDVYAYAAYGEMARTGIAPYSHAALPTGNAIFAAAVWQWGNPPPACVYGPAFVAIADAVVSATSRFGVLGALNGLRVLSSSSLLGAGALAYLAYDGDRRARGIAALVVAANPVSIWCSAEGHNDALALCVAYAGFALARIAPPVGAVIAALAGAVKGPGIVAAIPLALRYPRAWAGAVIGVVATIALSIPLIRAATTEVAPSGHYAPQGSLQAIFAAFPPLAIGAALIACAALAYAGFRRLRRGDASGWIYGVLGAWVLIPNPYPWYGIWLLAVAAVAPASRAGKVAIAISLLSLLRYAQDAAGPPNEITTVALGIVAVLPFLWLKPLSSRA